MWIVEQIQNCLRELVWSGGVGYDDLAARKRTGDQSRFRLGSITKTFTGAAILRLRDEGEMTLDIVQGTNGRNSIFAQPQPLETRA